MENKKIAVLIILLVVLIGLWGIMKVKNPMANNEAAVANAVNWTNKIPDIRTALKKDFPTEVEITGKISILRQDDIDGDGVKEATVYMGSSTGAAKNYSLMRYKSGQVSTARTKLASGLTVPAKFLQSSTTFHVDGIGVFVDKHTIYQGQATKDNSGKVSQCSAIAYVWNGATSTYDYNKTMSAFATPIYCAGLNPKG